LNIVQARANDRLRVGIILGVVALTMSQIGRRRSELAGNHRI
jgi:hypothetical protein